MIRRRHILSAAAASLLLLPGQAAAAAKYTTSQATSIVKQGFTQQIKARTALSGQAKFIGTTMKCTLIGYQTWTCYGTYTAKIDGEYATYGVYISANDTQWKTLGNGTLIKEWT